MLSLVVEAEAGEEGEGGGEVRVVEGAGEAPQSCRVLSGEGNEVS